MGKVWKDDELEDDELEDDELEDDEFEDDELSDDEFYEAILEFEKLEEILEKNIKKRLVEYYKNHWTDIIKNHKGPDRNIVGHFFGLLLVISRSRSKKGYFNCICECGNNIKVRKDNLISGRTKSCGCNRIKLDRKGRDRERIYKIWCSMISRCHDKNSQKYQQHGERGIKVCLSWHDFNNFYRWVNRSYYKDNYVIYRINAQGNYSPQNCCLMKKGTKVSWGGKTEDHL